MVISLSIYLCLFQLLNEKKMKESENMYKDFETPESASKV